METEEQKTARLAAEAQATKEADAAKAKADKEAAAATKKAEREAAALAKKTEREEAAKLKAAERDAAKQAKEQAKVEAAKAKEAEKEAAKAAAEEAKKANQQPEANGIRRPKADGMCGKAWTIFDEVSRKNGAPASIGETLPIATSQGINEATVRTQYARWRKFFGISGRVEAPKAPEAPAASVPAAPASAE